MQQQCNASFALFGKVRARWRWLGLVVLATFSAGLAGCWKAKRFVETEEPKPYVGIKLTIVCTDAAGRRDLLDQLARDWAARSGARIEILPNAADADIQVMTAAELPAWANKGALMEVPTEFRAPGNKYHWSELPGVFAEKLLRWDGKVYALPVVGEGHVLVYRTDNFAEKKLKAPATWEEFVEVAGVFSKADGDKSSLPPVPASADGLDRLFFTIASAYDRRVLAEGRHNDRSDEDAYFSFHYSLESGEPRIDRPAFVHALDLLQQMQKFRPAAPGDPIEAFRSGKAVMMLAPLDALARFQQPDSPVRDRVAIAAIPGAHFTFDYDTGEKQDLQGTVNRMPYQGWGSIVGTVRTSCTNPQAAWDFLADLGDPAMRSLELIGAAKWGAGPTRLTQLEVRNRNAWLGYGLSEAQTDQLIEQLRVNLAPGIANYRVRLRTPDEAPRIRALDDGLRSALISGEDPKAALEKVARAWKKLDESQPLAPRRDAYRKSLGL